MHEQPTGKSYQNLGTAFSRTGGYRLPAVHRANRLDSTTYFFGYDGSSWYYRADISNQEFNHSLAIIFVSAGGVGTGIGTFIQQFFGG